MKHRGKLLAKVHVAKKQMGLDEETYRALLERVTGATSAARLSEPQLSAIVAEFRRLGWAPKTATGKRPSDKPQTRMIWALWKAMGKQGVISNPTRAALRAFVLKQTSVSDPEWLDPRQATSVIEALKAWQRRVLARAAGDRP